MIICIFTCRDIDFLGAGQPQNVSLAVPLSKYVCWGEHIKEFRFYIKWILTGPERISIRGECVTLQASTAKQNVVYEGRDSDIYITSNWDIFIFNIKFNLKGIWIDQI